MRTGLRSFSIFIVILCHYSCTMMRRQSLKFLRASDHYELEKAVSCRLLDRRGVVC